MAAFWSNSHFDGGNAPYLEELYEQFLNDPNSLSGQWRQFFSQLPTVNGTGHDVAHSEVRRYFRELARQRPVAGAAPQKGFEALEYERKQQNVLELIEAYRFYGHRQAKIDPLELAQPAEVPELSLRHHQLSMADLDTEFATGNLHAPGKAALAEILEIVNETYCRTVGAEYMYITDSEEKLWLQQRLESMFNAQFVWDRKII
jgi:2-oxoglutarate dehydrogenase E1 component